LDIQGRVIGVNVAVAQGSQSIGFALPINSIKPAIESVRSTGKIIRPYIGVRYTLITPQIKQQNNLSSDYGVWIQSMEGQSAIVGNSPAAKAGLRETLFWK
jgi:S1-C subfamily serine protease